MAALAAGIIAGEPLTFLTDLVRGWRLTGPSGPVVLLLCGVATVGSVQAIRRRLIRGFRMRLSLLSAGALPAALGVVALAGIIAGG